MSADREGRVLASVYLAAAFGRQAELRAYRDALEARGIRVTSRWLDIEGTDQPDMAAECAEDMRPLHARNDLDDVESADMLVGFTGGSGRGGRHVEFGYAVALGKPIALVGPRENIFHWLPGVTHFDDWAAFLTHAELGPWRAVEVTQ